MGGRKPDCGCIAIAGIERRGCLDFKKEANTTHPRRALIERGDIFYANWYSAR